jgi:hypothetical protein
MAEGLQAKAASLLALQPHPFLSGTGPAPTCVVSLKGDRREALANRLSRVLPREPDGAISRAARAWAVRGVA